MQTEENVNGTGLNMRAWRREFLLFAVAVCFLSFTSGIFETTFNNFMVDVFHITPKARGQLEFPRELPGFLVALFAGALFFLTEVRMAALAAFVLSLGLFGFCALYTNYSLTILSMVIWSSGAHLFMPLNDTIALSLAGGKNAGTLMGRIGGYATCAVILGCGLVWLGREHFSLSYPVTFAIGAFSALLAGLVLLRMRPFAHSLKARPKFIWRKRYSLYYLLCVLFGARKQVFITFVPLVLIRVFDQPAQTIAKLWIVASILGIVFKPLLGRMIDHMGERFVLMLDAVLLIGVCLGYGLGRDFLPMPYTLYLVYTCFVLDMMLFAMEMARSIYLDKIALSRADVGPSLTLGISINHAVSMSIPALGGIIWAASGYRWVFFGAGGIAVVTLIAASFIRVPRGKRADIERAEMELVEEAV